MNDLVSVIILNWNTLEVLESCISSVENQTYKNVEIIIVDNGSQDGSQELIKKKYSQYKLILNKKNEGFSKGMNAGISISKGEFVVPLNVDVILKKDFIELAINFIAIDKKIGIIAPKIYRIVNGEKTEKIDSVGLFMAKRFTVKNSKNVDKIEYVFGAAGCCPFLRKKMLEDIKLAEGEYYDNSYFAFGEDIDLYFRAQIRGWKCVFSPDVIAWHSHSITSQHKIALIEKPSLFQRHALKNRYLNIIKNIPFLLMLYLFPYLLLTQILAFFYFLFKNTKNIHILFLAQLDTIGLLPATIRKRKHIQNKKDKDVSIIYLKSLFKRY